MRYATDGRPRYFPTVYEPTVFENYVHGKMPRLGLAYKKEDHIHPEI
jgi:hypothetical protein